MRNCACQPDPILPTNSTATVMESLDGMRDTSLESLPCWQLLCQSGAHKLTLCIPASATGSVEPPLEKHFGWGTSWGSIQTLREPDGL
jgi:hypothetical protein